MRNRNTTWTLEVRETTISIIDSRGEVVAYSPADVPTAELIAAAPEMLSEMKRVLSLLESIQTETGYVTTVTQLALEKLISKVTG